MHSASNIFPPTSINALTSLAHCFDSAFEMFAPEIESNELNQNGALRTIIHESGLYYEGVLLKFSKTWCVFLTVVKSAHYQCSSLI